MYLVLLRLVINSYNLSAVITLRRSCVAFAFIRCLNGVYSVSVTCMLRSSKVG